MSSMHWRAMFPFRSRSLFAELRGALPLLTRLMWCGADEEVLLQAVNALHDVMTYHGSEWQLAEALRAEDEPVDTDVLTAWRAAERMQTLRRR